MINPVIHFKYSVTLIAIIHHDEAAIKNIIIAK